MNGSGNTAWNSGCQARVADGSAVFLVTQIDKTLTTIHDVDSELDHDKIGLGSSHL